MLNIVKPIIAAVEKFSKNIKPIVGIEKQSIILKILFSSVGLALTLDTRSATTIINESLANSNDWKLIPKILIQRLALLVTTPLADKQTNSENDMINPK